MTYCSKLKCQCCLNCCKGGEEEEQKCQNEKKAWGTLHSSVYKWWECKLSSVRLKKGANIEEGRTKYDT